jgi:ATP-dependent Lhr-like helicase
VPARRPRPPGLTDLLRKLHARELSVVEVETATASPFASSLLFDYVATYMYEGDQPNASGARGAGARPRAAARAAGQEELRELIDEGALEQVEADLQRISERTRAESWTPCTMSSGGRRADDRRGRSAGVAGGPQGARPGETDAAAAASSPRELAAAWLEQLADERRAMVIRVGGERRWAAAEDAGLFRDGLGVVPPSGLPEAFTEDVPDAMERLVRRFARTHGPFETDALRDRYGVDFSPVLKALETRATWSAASSGPAARSASGATPRCCGGCGAPRSPRCARRSSRPTSARSRASCRTGRASTATRPPAPGPTGCARR